MGLDDLGFVSREQEYLIEHVIAHELIDQRVEKRPPADVEHWLRNQLGALTQPGA